jgi:hypothetical protein
VLRDPKLRLIALADAPDVEEARDDAGVSLMRPDPPEPAQPRPIVDRSNNPSHLRAMLSYPPAETSRAVALLRGHVSASVVTRTETVELVKDGKAVEPGKARSAGEVHFTVENAEPFGVAQASMQVKMTIPYGAAGEESHWDEVRALCHPDLIHVTDASGGGAYSLSTSVQSFRSDRGEYGVVITIHPAFGPGMGGGGGAGAGGLKLPARVTWDVPVEVTDLSVPVEFKNLPLP